MFPISPERLLDKLADEVDIEIADICRHIEKESCKNHQKVLQQFSNSGVADFHLKGSTGYGYNDAAREKLEQLYAGIFKTEASQAGRQTLFT